MKTVVIDGVEYELLKRTNLSAWRLEEGVFDICARPLPKPKKTILERVNEKLGACPIDEGHIPGMVAIATEERIAALEKQIEELKK